MAKIQMFKSMTLHKGQTTLLRKVVLVKYKNFQYHEISIEYMQTL